MRVLSTAVTLVVITSRIQYGDCFQPTNGVQRIIRNSELSQRRGRGAVRIQADGVILHSTTSSVRTKTETETDEKNEPDRQFQVNNKNHISTNNNSNQIKKQREPWKANFHTSNNTQKKIKSAAKMRASPIVRASTILKTLLNTDPTQANPSNLVCALTLSAKIVPKNAQRRHEFRHLLHETLDILSDLVEKKRLNTRQLANAAWAIAKHYCSDEQILPPTFHNSVEKEYLQGKAGGTSMVSLSEVWDLEEESNSEEEYRSEKKLLVTLENIANELMVTLSKGKNANGRKDLNEVEMSMVCWAYAVIHPRSIPAGWELPPRLEQMEKLEKEAMERINDDDGFMKDTTVTFETVKSNPSVKREEEEFVATSYVDKLFDAMAKTIVRPQKNGLSMVQMCGWKELSTISWSYANRGYCQSNAALNLVLHIADAAIARVEKASWTGTCDDIYPRDLSGIAWSLGVMQSDNYSLSDALEDFITAINDNIVQNGSHRPLKYWKSADCVQLAIALGHGRLDRQFLLREIYGEVVRSMKEDRYIDNGGDGYKKNFQEFELVVLLWVQARLYLTKEIGQVFDDFAEMLPGKLLYRMHMADSESREKLQNAEEGFDRIHLGAQEQANLAWSLTVLEKYKSRDSIDILRCIFNECAASCNESNYIRVEHGHQLWQSLCILEEECPEAIENVDDETYNFLKTMWDHEKSRHKTSSARHLALSETLNFMGVKHYNEYDEDIDLAIVLKLDSKWTRAAEHSEGDVKNRQRVAVEFDGPSHFTKIQKTSLGKKADPPRALGHTVLKYRILKKQGWTTVRIPFYEFDRIPFWSSMERQRYVQRKLKTHPNLKFSKADTSEYKPPVPNRKSRFD